MQQVATFMRECHEDVPTALMRVKMDSLDGGSGNTEC
jgi:hypothetical protein